MGRTQTIIIKEIHLILFQITHSHDILYSYSDSFSRFACRYDKVCSLIGIRFCRNIFEETSSYIVNPSVDLQAPFFDCFLDSGDSLCRIDLSEDAKVRHSYRKRYFNSASRLAFSSRCGIESSSSVWTALTSRICLNQLSINPNLLFPKAAIHPPHP